MIADHWTIGPLADRVGIIAVGMLMLAPMLRIMWLDHRKTKRPK